ETGRETLRHARHAVARRLVPFFAERGFDGGAHDRGRRPEIHESGDIDLAKTFYELSIELYRAMNIPLGLANCYAEFGNLLQSQGMQSDSDCMLQQADAIYRNLGLQICSKTSSSVDLRK
ncbi:MAG: hypothetical protein ACE5I1_09815, partial [bacterium]